MFSFEKKLIIGHRGCKLTAFNNTIESFLKAIELGVNMVEFDIRKTLDGVLIIHHDPDVFGLPINDTNFAQLKELAESKKLKLETLKNVLIALKGKIYLDVELKESGYEKTVVDLILKHFSTDEFIIKSFHDEAVLAIKTCFPDITAGLLLGSNDDLIFDRKISNRFFRFVYRKIHELFPWKRLKNCKADFVSPSRHLLHFGFLKNANKKHYPVLVWTVNKQKQQTKLLNCRYINGIISDFPPTI